MKRAFDLVVAGLGLLFVLPLMLGLALWIKLDSPGPVFYRGVRVGRHGKTFRIFKFRSMVVNAGKLGPASTADEDPRITRSGRFIRCYKLDELAQLLNVLKSDMSLVGPRPEVKHFVDKYTEEEKGLLQLRPGITDWASIWNSDEGGILEGADDADAVYEHVLRPTKLKLQLRYLQDHSLRADLKIIYYTFLRLMRMDFVAAEITDCPSFERLRVRALVYIAQEKRSRASNVCGTIAQVSSHNKTA